MESGVLEWMFQMVSEARWAGVSRSAACVGYGLANVERNMLRTDW